MKKLPVAAGLALALAAGSALAADLPSRKAPPPVFLPPPFTWTGIYAGINVGGAFGNADREYGAELGHGIVGPVFSGGNLWQAQSQLSGVTGGVQLGYNYQFSPWFVFGVEADIQAAGLESKASAFTPGVSGLVAPAGAVFVNNTYGGFAQINSHVDWWGTVRGRVGLTPLMPNLMIYGTGGFAYGQVNHNFSYASFLSANGAVVGPPPALFGLSSNAIGGANYDQVAFGWTAGGGIEYAPMMFPNWSLKAEYLYVDLGSQRLGALGVGNSVGTGVLAGAGGFFNTAIHNTSTRFHVVRAGINYRMNLFNAPAPVVAKY